MRAPYVSNTDVPYSCVLELSTVCISKIYTAVTRDIGKYPHSKINSVLCTFSPLAVVDFFVIMGEMLSGTPPYMKNVVVFYIMKKVIVIYINGFVGYIC